MATPERLRALVERLGPALWVGLAQAATGLLLLLVYRPDPALAHETTRRIADGPLAFVRSMHSWLATALLLLVLLHLAYAWTRGPAELRRPGGWLPRAALVALLLLAFQTGTVLAWDQRGWESYEHLRAGFGLDAGEPGTAPLWAVLSMHVAVVPIALVGLAAWRPEWRRGLATWASRWRDDAVAALAPILLMAIVAWFSPPPVGPAPIAGVSLTRPEWPFLWLVPLQDALGVGGLLLGVLALGGAVAAAPWFARSWSARARVVALWLVAATLAFLSVLALRQ